MREKEEKLTVWVDKLECRASPPWIETVRARRGCKTHTQGGKRIESNEVEPSEKKPECDC